MQRLTAGEEELNQLRSELDANQAQLDEAHQYVCMKHGQNSCNCSRGPVVVTRLSVSPRCLRCMVGFGGILILYCVRWSPCRQELAMRKFGRYRAHEQKQDVMHVL